MIKVEGAHRSSATEREVLWVWVWVWSHRSRSGRGYRQAAEVLQVSERIE